ncbi:MAG TPA: hypothetical protein PLH01_06190, partial [Kiritimatiellia bacterium]|nr:hypothetical protein [Kiritimatiellia bacterium]
YRDRLFNHEHTGWHCSGFFGTPEGIPDFHEVSCVSWFHSNRDRYRDRYRDRSFQGFRVSVARDPLETGLPPGAEIAYA